MIYEEIQKKLSDNGCGIFVLSSCYGELEEAIRQTVKEPIKNMIEIGTHNGLSAAIFTHFADRVFTFDVALRNQEFVWDLLGVRNKISAMVSTRDNLEWELNYIKTNNFWKEAGFSFNYSFLDGSHEYYCVARDFEIAQHTGRVLFHDYQTNPGVKAFCNEIGAVPLENVNFAYWENV
jgi:hypothetical protein